MDHPNHRKYPRYKISVPVEIHTEAASTPFRAAATDLSIGGCYVETMFPFPVNTALELKLQIQENTVLIVANIITCDPLVGNGIQFLKMLPEDREALRAFLDTQEPAAEVNS
jgi:c-di-GMP-binding flagellar brake protein YcgR